MAFANEKTWRQLQLRRLQYLYGQQVKAWEGKYRDDRDVLCRMYRQMEAAIKELPAEPGKYVQVAMNEKMRADRATMDKIVKVFEARRAKA